MVSQRRFATFIQPQLVPLRRAAYRLCRNMPDAEDLVQDVCLRAFETLGEQDIAAPRAWLLRIQYNLHVDGLRRQGRHAIESLDTARFGSGPRGSESEGLTAAAQPAEPASPAPSPEQQADTSQRVAALDLAWGQLNKDQQALLALYAEGYRLSEIADVTTLPIGAIKARLHRARTRLGKLLRSQSPQDCVAAQAGESL